MAFRFRPAQLQGLCIIDPQLYPDGRGFFMETYKHSDFARAGIPSTFVQDNHSSSSRGIVRGLHYQLPPHAQGKLVRVPFGSVWDVAVDLRRGSPTFGKWVGLELSQENRMMLFIPPGFAHGFLALSEHAELFYKCTSEYDRASEAGVRWNDPDLGIGWPTEVAGVSEKDGGLPFLREARLFDREGGE